MKPVSIFVGYDPKEAIVFHNCVNSIIRNASAPVSIVPLSLNLLNEYKETHTDGSNDFTYSRFLVPYLMGFKDRAIFIDGDMIVQGDIVELYESLSIGHDVAVVKHDYKTTRAEKYLGNVNKDYPRKNWSSVIVWNCGTFPNMQLTPEFVQQHPGSFLHRFNWLEDDRIQELPKEWNWLPDELGPNEQAKLLHWTLGAPCFDEFKGAQSAETWFNEYKLMTRPLSR